LRVSRRSQGRSVLIRARNNGFCKSQHAFQPNVLHFFQTLPSGTEEELIYIKPTYMIARKFNTSLQIGFGIYLSIVCTYNVSDL